MKFIDSEDIIEFNRKLSRMDRAGILDKNGLISATNAPKNRFLYDDAVDIVQCASSLFYHLIKAHAFIDGNKRTAAHALEVFLNLNGMKFIINDNNLIELCVDVASSAISKEKLESIIWNNIKES